MKKNGFTLVELLAVIVILAVILAIAIPGIGKLIDSSTRNAFESNAKMVLKAAELKQTANDLFNPLNITEENIEEELNISPSNYEKLTIKEVDGKLFITIVGKNKWGNLTTSGTRQLIRVYKTRKYNPGDPNEPNLVKGMTPIRWNGTKWIETVKEDGEWYDYDNKIWANAKTADGSYWVWIPRYIYNITSGWHSNDTGTIEVKFSQGVDDTLGGAVSLDLGSTAEASNNKWTNHPAFTFGSFELTGIWVAKFEATAAEGVSNAYEAGGSCDNSPDDDSVLKTVKIIPNVKSWRCLRINNAFLATRNMETNPIYGWDTASTLKDNGEFEKDNNNLDTHLMKNTEWGAVIYLSKSQYGKNSEEIWANSNSQQKTGCSGSKIDAINEELCNQYYTSEGVKSSTTGNIYGIYDLSGGAWEYVSSYIDNGNFLLENFGSSIISASAKYKNVYEKATIDSQPTNYNLAINKKGDTIYEISSNTGGMYSWFDDINYMPETNYPWFTRGGAFHDIPGAFNFSSAGGWPYNSGGFRPTLVIGEGL